MKVQINLNDRQAVTFGHDVSSNRHADDARSCPHTSTQSLIVSPTASRSDLSTISDVEMSE